MSVGGAVASTSANELNFVDAVARGAAALEPEELLGGSFAPALELSAWIAMAAIDAGEACESMLRLRLAVLEASCLDPQIEPVPLVPRDRRLGALNLYGYLAGLLARAARGGTRPLDVAVQALDLLAG